MTRDAAGRISGVNVVEYDRLRGRLGDPSQDRKTGRSAGLPAEPRPADSLEEGRRRQVWYEVERKRLELDEMRGALLRRDALEAAVRDAGNALAHILDRLPHQADALMVAVTRDGLHGLRSALRSMALQMRQEASTAFAALAADAPAEDPPIENPPIGGFDETPAPDCDRREPDERTNP